MSADARRENTAARIRRRVNFLWDLFVLACISAAIIFINTRAIPYIDTVYHYSASAVRIEKGLEGLLSGILSLSPTEWFHTSIYSIDLPSYKWYIALLLAVMVQIVAGDIESYLDMGWTKRHGRLFRLASEGVVSFLLTEFILALTMLSLLTICPQNSKLLFLLLEFVLFCLPAAIHFLRRRKQWMSTGAGLALTLVNVILIFLTVDKAVVCSILLFVVQWIGWSVEEKLQDAEPDSERKKIRWTSFAGLALSVVWIIVVGCMIRPYIRTYLPELEIVQKEIYVSSIDVHSDYEYLFVRKDGAAVNAENDVYCENVRQAVICDRNSFFLTQDGQVLCCSSPGNEPVLFMDQIQWLSSYGDVMIAVDNTGNLWGFGDLTGYYPGGAYCSQPALILEGRNLVMADIGRGHILMIDASGDLYGMGENLSGELGNGTRSIQVEGFQHILSGIRQAKAGIGFSYALGNDGTMYVWGRNDVGQLGTEVSPSSFRLGAGYALNEGQTCLTRPTVLSLGNAPIRQIAAGAECGFALDENGSLWVWGKNITEESMSLPEVYREHILWIADNKYQAGILNQKCFYIAEDEQAYSYTLGNLRHFDEYHRDLVFDNSNKMPEPVEIVNSWLEERLDRIPLFGSGEPEALAPEIQVTQVQAPYNDQGVHALQSFQGHTYRIFDELMYLENAQAYCESMGGHLATITSAEEHAFLKSLIGGDRSSSFFGIGLKYSNGLYWLTGESTAYVESLGVEPAYADPKGEGYLNSSGQLNVGMMVKHPFLCEWE